MSSRKHLIKLQQEHYIRGQQDGHLEQGDFQEHRISRKHKREESILVPSFH